MTREVNITPYDSADYLNSAEDIEAYLQAMQKEIDDCPEHGSELMLLAIGVIARAKNKAELSKESGLSRQGIYKALSPNARPSFETMFKLIHALGLHLNLGVKA